MHSFKNASIRHKDFAEIFQRPPVTVVPLIPFGHEKIGEMEVLFHEKCDVYGCNCEEKISFVLLHLPYKFFVIFHKPKYQL